MIQAAVLGIAQGLTEFLPISSSGHLLLIQKIPGFYDFGLFFDAFLHLGTLLAVLVYFKKDILRLIKSLFNKDQEGRKFLYLVLVATIPAALFGYFIKDLATTSFRSPLLVVFNLIFWGVVLAAADWYADKNKSQITSEYKVVWPKGIVIGLFQAVALIPGTSRSGITISAGLFQGLSREAAARFSFLLGIPAIAGAGLLSFLEITQTGNLAVMQLSLGFLFSFLSGILAIHWLLKILNKHGLRWLALYRIALGVVLLIFIFFK